MTLEEKLNEFGIKKIMVVDDSEENRKAAEEYFRRIGIEVHYANSEKSALEMLKEKEYDMVITDLKMEQDLSGMNVVKEASKKAIPSYIVTGFSGSGSGHHGPKVKILPPYINDVELKYEYFGTKAEPDTWNKILEHCLKAYEESIETIKAMKRYKKEVGKDFTDEQIELLYMIYDLDLLKY